MIEYNPPGTCPTGDHPNGCVTGDPSDTGRKPGETGTVTLTAAQLARLQGKP